MARAYLNSLSFPAETLEHSMVLLSDLRSAIATLIKERTIALPVMCSIRASSLALSPSYKVLADGLALDRHRFRDTVLFFLQTLDQQSPAQAALEPELQAEMDPHLLDGALNSTFDADGPSVLVACALDNGVLLSIGSDDRWRSDKVGFDMMTATSTDVRSEIVDNVWNDASAGLLVARDAEARARHRFVNWEELTGNAAKATQIDEWFDECRRRPGLEQLIMRSISIAHAADYRVDGDLVKKLGTESSTALFEIRAYFNGSNNVRLLFSRNADGRAIYGYGGIKSHSSWYDTAIPQAAKNIRVYTNA